MGGHTDDHKPDAVRPPTYPPREGHRSCPPRYRHSPGLASQEVHHSSLDSGYVVARENPEGNDTHPVHICEATLIYPPEEELVVGMQTRRNLLAGHVDPSNHHHACSDGLSNDLGRYGYVRVDEKQVDEDRSL